MRTLKRLTATLVEIAAEAILWGCLLGAMVADQTEPFWYGVLGSILALPVILFLHGYYLTRIVAGTMLRIGGQWLYPSIAASLFAVHMSVVYVRLEPDMSAFGKVLGPPFIAGGACIVLGCAIAGSWLSRRWAVSAPGARLI